MNVLAYRWLAVSSHVPGRHKIYRLETTSGLILYYRRNRGDIQGIREILIDEIYRLPQGAAPRSLVDLGANIGIASVWLAREYSLQAFAAIEPIPENFALLEKNCLANGLRGKLDCAAVGPKSGTTHFDTSAGSNMGRAGDGALEVAVRGIVEWVGALDYDATLLKMDVEGMEGELLQSIDASWIAQFAYAVMEMHPEYVNIDSLIATICAQGFTYFEPVQSTSGLTRSKRERLFVRNPCTLSR
jgi:FkbM family methyltransferase